MWTENHCCNTQLPMLSRHDLDSNRAAFRRIEEGGDELPFRTCQHGAIVTLLSNYRPTSSNGTNSKAHLRPKRRSSIHTLSPHQPRSYWFVTQFGIQRLRGTMKGRGWTAGLGRGPDFSARVVTEPSCNTSILQRPATCLWPDLSRPTVQNSVESDRHG